MYIPRKEASTAVKNRQYTVRIPKKEYDVAEKLGIDLSPLFRMALRSAIAKVLKEKTPTG